MLTMGQRLELHWKVQRCQSMSELKELCRILIERDIAYQEAMKAQGIVIQSLKLTPPNKFD